MKDYCFGIDVGGTSVKCGLFKTDGALLEKWEIPTRKEEKGALVVPDIAATILKKLEDRGLSKDDVEGIGVGVPGPVDQNGKVLVAVNLYWGEKDLSNEMQMLTGIRTVTGNDANVAALGEAWKGAAAGAASCIMLTLGTGVGGGIIVNGRILTGAHGAAGELGHFHVDDTEEEYCNCGNRGCLEQYASATGIAHLARRHLQESDKPSPLRNLKRVSAKNVFDAYKQGDELADDIVEDFGRRLGYTMAGFATVLDPEIFVIGGGVSYAGEALIEILRKYYQKVCIPSLHETPIVLATLGNEAGIYGAARMLLA